jgi:hypothetical protein
MFGAKGEAQLLGGGAGLGVAFDDGRALLQLRREIGRPFPAQSAEAVISLL